MVESLSEEQLNSKTLAGHWTPHHVLGHVVFLAEFKLPSFMFGMAKAGFNYDKMADRATREIGRDLGEFPKRDEVKLVPTDLDWTSGRGPEVVGTGEAILMTLAGRPTGSELSGEGAGLLR